jgi:hypothetical protein
MQIKRYVIDNRGIEREHVIGPYVKYEDHLAEVAKLRSYFIKKLSALNQIMVEAIGTDELKSVLAPEQGIESESEVVNAGIY